MNSTKRKWNKHYNNNYNKTEKIEFKYKMTIVYNPPPPSSSSLLLLPPPPTPTDLIGTRRSFLYQCLCWLRYLKKKEEENCKTTHKKNWKKKSETKWRHKRRRWRKRRRRRRRRRMNEYVKRCLRSVVVPVMKDKPFINSLYNSTCIYLYIYIYIFIFIYIYVYVYWLL